MNNEIFINLRCLQRPTTGVQRYTQEVSARLGIPWTGVRPNRVLGHLSGPVWDQSVLAVRAKGGVLWSPANTGPVLHPRHVVTVHDLSVLQDATWFSPLFRSFYAALIPALIKRALCIITDSEFIRREMLCRFPGIEGKVEVCHLGVTPNFFMAPEPAKERPYLLAVGSLDPRKNLPRLFKAWKAIQHRHRDLELRVVGGGSRIFNSMDPAEFRDCRITFLSRLPEQELLDQYRSATAFCFPSLYEGFGLPVLEAMAAGIPVLTSENSSMSEIVQGQAVLVDPKNVDSIAAGMDALLDDAGLRASLGQAGPTVARDFTWGRTAERVDGILRRCLP